MAYQRRAGATILLASHNMAEVERMCGHVLMMRAGTIVDRGTPAELVARYGRKTMEEVFLAIAREQEEGRPEPVTPPDVNGEEAPSAKRRAAP
jgi:ABC-2 type transport system ATP-binding protein